MSMNNANSLLSPCELLRQLNDIFQTDTPFDNEMRRKLAQIESMTKDMSIRLYNYEKQYFTMWKPNPTYSEDMQRRTSKEYKFSV